MEENSVSYFWIIIQEVSKLVLMKKFQINGLSRSVSIPFYLEIERFRFENEDSNRYCEVPEDEYGKFLREFRLSEHDIILIERLVPDPNTKKLGLHWNMAKAEDEFEKFQAGDIIDCKVPNLWFSKMTNNKSSLFRLSNLFQNYFSTERYRNSLIFKNFQEFSFWLKKISGRNGLS